MCDNLYHATQQHAHTTNSALVRYNTGLCSKPVEKLYKLLWILPFSYKAVSAAIPPLLWRNDGPAPLHVIIPSVLVVIGINHSLHSTPSSRHHLTLVYCLMLEGSEHMPTWSNTSSETCRSRHFAEHSDNTRTSANGRRLPSEICATNHLRRGGKVSSCWLITNNKA